MLYIPSKVQYHCLHIREITGNGGGGFSLPRSIVHEQKELDVDKSNINGWYKENSWLHNINYPLKHEIGQSRTLKFVFASLERSVIFAATAKRLLSAEVYEMIQHYTVYISSIKKDKRHFEYNHGYFSIAGPCEKDGIPN